MGGGPELIGRVVYHPAQLAAVGRVAGLIETLRLLKTPAEFSEFQKALFQEVHSAQLALQKASQQAKRATAGKTTEVPPVASQDWATERLVRDRIQRQFRAVGDALAWRLFNFDRRYILALSRNNDPGPMAGKEGLPYELGHVTDLWEKKGVFALLHDLTNYLRIADVTEFRSEGPFLREVKKTARLSAGQLARMQRVVSVINNGAPLPGDLGQTVSLVKCPVQLKTVMTKLGDALDAADRDGTACVRAGDGWVIQAISGLRVGTQTVESVPEGLAEAQRKKLLAFERAGLLRSMHHLTGHALGDLGTDPALAPPTIFPLTADQCARLTCDLLSYQSIVGFERIDSAFTAAGFTVMGRLPPANGDIAATAPVLDARLGNRAVTLHAYGFSQILLELVLPERFAEAIREVGLSPEGRRGPGVFTFANERAVWR